MKYIAVFLILNLLLLSAFTFTSKAGIHHATGACCKEQKHTANCEQQKHHTDDDCTKGNCNAMPYCGTCAFVITACVSISPTFSNLSSQNIHLFTIGELSDYHGNGWNPPKV
jgi:hypothetical protein